MSLFFRFAQNKAHIPSLLCAASVSVSPPYKGLGPTLPVHVRLPPHLTPYNSLAPKYSLRSLPHVVVNFIALVDHRVATRWVARCRCCP
eukprot:10351652-Heterocapsa_arctica.AAC.1